MVLIGKHRETYKTQGPLVAWGAGLKACLNPKPLSNPNVTPGYRMWDLPVSWTG